MSYCRPRWVSDYTYMNIMAFRDASADRVSIRAQDQRLQPSLVVWGRIVNGRPVLEPAFLVQTKPALPTKAGPYHLEGIDASGGRLFSISFEGSPVADGLGDEEHFAYAVPVDPAAAAGLVRLTLNGPAGSAHVSSSAAVRAGPPPAPDMRRFPGRIELRWDATTAPMVMVRDASTREVLALGRGGVLQVPTRGAQVEVHVSHGASSRRLTLP